jgi:hypothetical protein
MAIRKTLPGCAVQSPDYEVVVLIDAWDDETGLVYPSGEGAPNLVRGDYLPGSDTPASFWPQLAAPYAGWRINVVPTPVRIRLGGRQPKRGWRCGPSGTYPEGQYPRRFSGNSQASANVEAGDCLGAALCKCVYSRSMRR